jgi:hypothetical protein
VARSLHEVLTPPQREALERVRRRVVNPAFYAPRPSETLLAWASHRGRGPLGAIFSRVFDDNGRDPFDWDAFAAAAPYFEEPEGDFPDATVVLVSDPAPPGELAVRPCVVVSLNLDALRGREGLIALVDRVAEALTVLMGAAEPG